MRNTQAKRLRRKAEALTVGSSQHETRAVYKELKRDFKRKV